METYCLKERKYQDFNPEMADFYDESSKLFRFLLVLIILNWKFIIFPIFSYNVFKEEELRISQESLKRKMNKLYMKGILNQ